MLEFFKRHKKLSERLAESKYPVLDPEHCYNVDIVPMDKNGDDIGGECRRLWIHEKYWPELKEFIDKLHEKQCLDDSVHTVIQTTQNCE